MRYTPRTHNPRAPYQYTPMRHHKRHDAGQGKTTPSAPATPATSPIDRATTQAPHPKQSNARGESLSVHQLNTITTTKASQLTGPPHDLPARVMRSPFFLEWMGSEHSEQGGVAAA